MGEAKRKKQRECPAKGGIITPEDCGRGRNSSIACPVECPHNPFNPANHAEGFAALEEKVLGHLSRQLAGDLTPSQLREVAAMLEDADEFAFHAHQVWQIHGTGRLEKWIAAGFHKSWKNDEQVLLGCLATLRPSLIEFREVLDDTSCTAVDLLDPGAPFRLIDASAAAEVSRYELGLGWTYDVPAGRRLCGGTTTPPRIDGLEPADMFGRLLDHLGAPAGHPREWILEHVPLLADAFTAIAKAQQQAQIRASDLRRFTLRFPIAAGQSPAVVPALAADPRVFIEEADPDAARLTACLLAEGVDREHDEEAAVIGELKVELGGLEIVSLSAKRADAARTWVASLGLPLGPEETFEEDAGAAFTDVTYDRDLVPPEFLNPIAPLDFPATVQLREGNDLPGSELAWLYRGFADRPHQGLGGKTPREAAADPSLRPQVVRLMKNLTSVCDRQRRENGVEFDFNVVLREVGLDELVLPAPPVGFVERDDDFDDDEIPLDPPPPQEMLDGDELSDRLQAATGDEALWNRLEIRLADVLDAFNDLSDKLNAHELEALQSTVLAALGALHPDQPPGYEPDPGRMLARYEAWITSGDDQEDMAAFVERIFDETRQPALCEAAADMMFFLEKQSGKRLRPKKLDVLMTALAAAVWEAAHWPPALKS